MTDLLLTPPRPTRHDLHFIFWCDEGAKLFSTCQRRQYLAIVTSADGRVVGTGYNGAPPGMPHCTDSYCPRVQEDPAHGTPYDSCTALHAEANALLYSDRTARIDGTLYVNGPPCWDCGKLIAGSGIARLVCREDREYEDWGRVMNLLGDAGVRVVVV